MSHVPEKGSSGPYGRPMPNCVIVRPKITRKKKTGSGLFTRRAFARTYCRKDIIFRTVNAKVIHKGVMYNHCPDGMYIETARYLSPGTRITVKTRSSARRDDREKPRQYRGRIVWCRLLEDQSSRRFGAGVSFNDSVTRLVVNQNRKLF